MPSVCFYFQVHQPYRLRKYTIFDIKNSHNYFDDEKNYKIMRRIADKCYLPTNKLLLDLINDFKGKFKIAYSFTGVVLEQFERYVPEVLESFKKLVDTGCVEILDETYYHSLAFLYSKKEFKDQIRMHNKKIRELFNYKSKIFRNTELTYNNELANFIEKMGYKGILAEGADHILEWRSPNFIYKAKTTNNLKLLLKNYKLSDDIAFRFSERSWKEWPLKADKFAAWVSNTPGNIVNLFMDYETFGEHQWDSTGIFEFLRHLPYELIKYRNINFKTPKELIKLYDPVAELDIHNVVSWADIERDLSAWLGNKMQQTALAKIYELREKVLKSKDKKLIEDWRKLQTSDHFYYMCTKWFADGDVHKYFNPYDSPYECFIAYMNILNDINLRLERGGVQNGNQNIFERSSIASVK